MLLFNLGLSLLTGVAFGLAPALQASRVPLNEPLKEGSRTTTESATRGNLRSLLVISETALAMVLLIGAGLLLKSLLRSREIDPGFKTDHILSMTLDLTPAQYPTGQAQAAFFIRSSNAPGRCRESNRRQSVRASVPGDTAFHSPGERSRGATRPSMWI